MLKMKTRALDRWVAPAKQEASSVMSVLGAPKFTGGTLMEVDLERLQRTMQWLAIRKEAGLKLDLETAEVEWCYAQTLDPYGVDPDLPEQCQQIGREYFARSPASDVWVNFREQNTLANSAPGIGGPHIDDTDGLHVCE
jgi:hypothetical protein